MNSDSSLCAILRAGHLKSKHEPKQNNTTKNGHQEGCAKQQRLNAETRDPPSQDPRDHTEQPYGMTFNTLTL